jgi:purine-nucleoside phosphorylase
MSTPHNQANISDIAKVVLLPGDPLRAKYIADNYLKDVTLFNTVRNMFGYTGTYKGVRISVMGTGMGMPSIGIYAYELYNVYDVDVLIRIGTSGSYKKEVKVNDIVLAMGACTDSTFARQYQLPGTYTAIADYSLLEKAVDIAKAKKMPYHVGNIFSEDCFYSRNPNMLASWSKMNILSVEMEAYALYCLAAYAHKKALAILTISNSIVTGESTDSEHREKALTDMMVLALELGIKQ